MELIDTISNDIKEAMKNKQKDRLNALRYVKKLLIENKTSKAPKAELDIVISHHKKLKESLSMFPEGSEQLENTKNEIEFLSVYLPEQMTEESVKTLIEKIKASQENPNMGSIMRELQPQIKGKFDGKLASQMVRAAVS